MISLTCPCCSSKSVVKSVANFARRLVAFVRKATGETIDVTSGFRCPGRNKIVVGAPNSAHLLGLAVDVSVKSSKAYYAILWFAISSGAKGIGLGQDELHLDFASKLTKLPDGSGTYSRPSVWFY